MSHLKGIYVLYDYRRVHFSQIHFSVVVGTIFSKRSFKLLHRGIIRSSKTLEMFHCDKMIEVIWEEHFEYLKKKNNDQNFWLISQLINVSDLTGKVFF